MARETPDNAEFMYDLRHMGDKIYDFIEYSKDPLEEIVEFGAKFFLFELGFHTPYWTGLLASAQKLGPKDSRRESKSKAWASNSVWIDPGVTKQHEHWGEIPSVYGTRYSVERRDWFAETWDAVADGYFFRAERIFAKYVAGFDF